MPITRDEFEKLVSFEPYVERIATISSDGKNLLVRIPKDVRDFLKLKKGDRTRFLVNEEGKISVEVLRENAKEKKKAS